MFNSVQQCSIVSKSVQQFSTVFNSVLKSLMPLKPLKPLKNKTLKHCDCVGFGLLTARTGDFYCKIKTRQNKTTMKCVLKISCHFKSYHQIIKSKLLIKSKSNSNQIKPFVFFVLFCYVSFCIVLSDDYECS